MVWEIALVIFLLSFTVLIYLTIPVVLQFKSMLRKAGRTLDVLNDDLPDILKNLNELSETANETSQKVKSAVTDITELEKLLSDEIKKPLQNIAQSVATLLQLLNKLFLRKSPK